MTHDRTPERGLQVHDSAGVIAPPPLIYGIGFAVGLMLNRLMPIPIARHHKRACRATGLVLATLGLGISAAVVRAFRAAGTSDQLPDQQHDLCARDHSGTAVIRTISASCLSMWGHPPVQTAGGPFSSRLSPWV